MPCCDCKARLEPGRVNSPQSFRKPSRVAAIMFQCTARPSRTYIPWLPGRPSSTCHAPHRPAASTASPERSTVTVYFKAADVVVEAAPGENIYELAKRSGVDITVGCCSNSCGICEVEVTLVDASGVASAPRVTRSCVAGIPPGFARIEIDDLEDGIWGVDGYDT